MCRPPQSEPQGYATQAYAESLSEFGTPRELTHARGWVLERPIPGSERRDAMGCYPLLCCDKWEGIAADFREIGTDLVSLVVVCDPFAPLTPAALEGWFDRVSPFKEHLVADLSRPLEQIVSPKRYQAAQRALRRVSIEVAQEPAALVDDWCALYEGLVKRHGLTGIKALSRRAIEGLLSVPGLVALRATCEGETVGMHLELVSRGVVYGHLAAYSEAGRRLGAAGALHLCEIEHFIGKARWIDWGGVAGIHDRADGLKAFKQGFANATKPTYLCSKVFDPPAYRTLQAASGTEATAYFPAYRAGEFT